MGVDGSGDVPMEEPLGEARGSGEQELRERSEMETTIKVDTVVLPEGVCLLDKAFVIIEKDPDGKKFDKVSRYICRCSNAPLEMLLDVNVDVYPLKIGASLQVMVTTSLHYDGSPMPSTFSHAVYKQKTLMDEFEYVCFGRVFKVKDAPDSKLQVFASFGGLIMRLIGDGPVLDKFQMDQNVYLLTRTFKTSSRKSQIAKRPNESMLGS